MLETIPLDKIHPAPDNPRADVGDVTDLAATIKAVGLLQPLGVTPDDAGGYTLVVGHRRYAALQLLGAADTECKVLAGGKAMTTGDRLESALVENGQRKDLTPIEEAQTYQQLLDEHGYSQRKLADRIGRPQSQISKRLPLLKLPADVQADVDAATLPIADALELVALVDHDVPPSLQSRIPKALAAARADIVDRGQSAKQAVAYQLRDLDRLAKREAALTKLRGRKGLSVIDAPDAYGVYSIDSAYKKLGKGWGELPVAIGIHARHGCHAAAVLREGETVYVCTKPSNHADAVKTHDGRSRDDIKAQQAKTRERNKALKACMEKRASTLRAILAKPALNAAAAHVARIAVLARDMHDTHTPGIACDLLDLQPTERGDGKWAFGEAERSLHEYATRSEHHMRSAALALVLAVGEKAPRKPGTFEYQWRHDATKAHYEFLETQGYTLDPIERQMLAGDA